ncbi:MAG TPA: ATP-binding protein, partial [Candidatus Polarisedimenticolia bacterium]|nr:ATP-binding protein [Candidatus Polarisedimenticolia bacterium]
MQAYRIAGSPRFKHEVDDRPVATPRTQGGLIGMGHCVDVTAGQTADRHRQTILLRGMLIVAVGGLLIDAGIAQASTAALGLVLIFGLSNALLPFLPKSLLRSQRFDLMLGAGDLFLVGLGIHMAGAIGGALPISCLLMTLVMALGHHRASTVAGAAAVGALHAWLLLRTTPDVGIGRQLVLQMLFLCSVGLYYGFMTERSHHRRRTAASVDQRDRELSTFLDILATTTRSHDVRQVTLSIVSKLTGIVPAVRCSIVQVSPDLSQAHVLVSHDDPALDMLELDLEKYPEIREALRSRTPIIVQDMLHNPMLAEVRDRLKALDFQSLIVIPLTFGEEVMGALCVKAARVNQAFTRREIDFCTAAAGAAAHVMRNALLHRRGGEEASRHRATTALLTTVLDQSPDPIFTTDGDGRIVEFSRGAERLLGFRKEEIQGCHSTRLFGRRGAAATPGAGGITLLRTRAGPEIEIELRSAPLDDGFGATAGHVWVGRDVTSLESHHLKALQAEKLSAIGDVISGVAHELNNPLCGVLGFSQLLLARATSGPLASDLEKIHESALRCQKIVRNLLSFARGHTPQRRYLGVNGIIDKTLDLKRSQLQGDDIEVVPELQRDLPRTMVDFHQMQQVFLNLIDNARQAIELVPDRRGRLLVRTWHDEGAIKVEISDNGCGMTPEVARKAFDPFFTTWGKGRGTGLGLSVCHGIVQQHGGRIEARGRPGEGATFIVELPIVGAGTVEAGSNAPAQAVRNPARGRRILVVDDEPLVVDLLISILEGIGHTVDTAQNGLEAYAKIRAQSYELIITDIRMPQMSGMDLYRRLLDRHPEMTSPVLFITGDLIDQ